MFTIRIGYDVAVAFGGNIDRIDDVLCDRPTHDAG
jgi:hypothetical protein